MIMIVEYGTRVLGKTILIPKDLLDKYEPVHDSIYQIEILTQGIKDPEKVAEHLSRELYDRFRLRVIWIRVSDPHIYMQVMPNHPIAWTVVLFFIPIILKAIAIVVVAITVFLLVSKLPSWQIILAIVAGILTYGAISIAEIYARRKYT